MAITLVISLLVGITINKNVLKSKACEDEEINETQEYDENDYETRPEDNEEEEDFEEIVPTSEEIEAMRELYNNIPSEQLEQFRMMTDEEIQNKEVEIMGNYNVGEEFSEVDRNFMLYITYEYNVKENSRVWTTRQHKIKNSKTECGVTASYNGYLETWGGAKNCQYGANVKCTLSKKVKSAKFKVHHSAYGVLGWSGKIPSIGMTYNDKISSSGYKKSFTYKKFKKYSAFCTVYMITWGELDVKTNTGEFNVRTQTYKDIQ